MADLTSPGPAATCGRCHKPFDPSDTRFDGAARYGVTPWCRGCVDRCHESTDAFHACPVCDPTRRDAPAGRCPTAHPADKTPCSGPVVVTVLDRHNAGADGCEHHAARLLASLEGGRVYGLPEAPEGAAIRVFKAAQTIEPFVWMRRGGDGS